MDPVQFYRDNGYWLHKEPLFDTERFRRLGDLFEELLTNKDPTKRADQLDVPHFAEPRLFEFLMADEVLDLVEPFIGPHIGLWSSHFICKEPAIGRATPWHEDSAYWNGRMDQLDRIVTVWLAIDDADALNSAMKVIPGSHTGHREMTTIPSAENAMSPWALSIRSGRVLRFFKLRISMTQYSEPFRSMAAARRE